MSKFESSITWIYVLNLHSDLGTKHSLINILMTIIHENGEKRATEWVVALYIHTKNEKLDYNVMLEAWMRRMNEKQFEFLRSSFELNEWV